MLYRDIVNYDMVYKKKGRLVAMATINQKGEDKENAKKRTTLVEKNKRVLREAHF